MIPIYLMFATEAEALDVLMEDGAPRWPTSVLQWLPVQISRPTGGVDAEGLEIFEPIPGYHVNALWDGVAEISALTPYRTYPDTPSVIWAGLSEA